MGEDGGSDGALGAAGGGGDAVDVGGGGLVVEAGRVPDAPGGGSELGAGGEGGSMVARWWRRLEHPGVAIRILYVRTSSMDAG